MTMFKNLKFFSFLPVFSWGGVGDFSWLQKTFRFKIGNPSLFLLFNNQQKQAEKIAKLELMLNKSIETLHQQDSSITKMTVVVESLTTHINTILLMLTKLQEQTGMSLTELARSQSISGDAIRQLAEGQNQIVQTQTKIAQEQIRLQELIATLIAGHEEHEQILDYLLRNSQDNSAQDYNDI